MHAVCLVVFLVAVALLPVWVAADSSHSKSEKLELPPLPNFVEIDAMRLDSDPSIGNWGIDVRAGTKPASNKDQLRAGLAHLTQEIFGLRKAIEQARNEAVAKQSVQIRPFIHANDPSGFKGVPKPIALSNPFASPFEHGDRGPLGKLKDKLKDARRLRDTARKSEGLPPVSPLLRKVDPRHPFKGDRGPVGKLRERRSTRSAKSSASAPSGELQRHMAKLHAKRKRINLNGDRGPVGRMRKRAALPAQLQERINAIRKRIEHLKALKPPNVKSLDKMDRGPVGKLKNRRGLPPLPPMINTNAHTSGKLQPTPLAVATPGPVLRKDRGPVGKLKKRHLPLSALPLHGWPSAAAAASGWGSVVPRRANKLRADRGPVGRLKKRQVTKKRHFR